MQSMYSIFASQASRSKPRISVLPQLLSNGSFCSSTNVFPNLPKSVTIVEVGPRDGLQNEKSILSADIKLKLIDHCYKAGLRRIEAGAFVSPKWVPQMGDAEVIFSHLGHIQTVEKYPGATFSALTPNMKGFEMAASLGVQEVAVFGAASESFSKKNINCSIDESLVRFEEVCSAALAENIRVRGYVSCVLGCPYEGKTIKPEKVGYVTQRLLDMGCYEVSLGDTIGTGGAGTTHQLLHYLLNDLNIDRNQLAVHFHNTYGQALSNILVSLQHGIAVIDCSVSGLGGCPYAKGASGNVPTEEVVYMLQSMGIDTGNIDLTLLMQAGSYIDKELGNRVSESKVALALAERTTTST